MKAKREKICEEIRDNFRRMNNSLIVAARNLGYIEGALSERKKMKGHKGPRT